ncbi:interleukin-2 receptor subunit beta-like isoform X1 [Siphateles boraxobius]|uniref:interleukin-2 receptor subunit beta-like isoform X1 n=2 Tax=Siphateles boraxobius TaxID=180520 RepID=UPI00406476C6
MQILTMMMMIMIMMMSFLYSALSDQGLECYNDFHNTFTCVWDSSKLRVRPETSCKIRVTVRHGFKKEKTAPMLADPTRTHIRSATVDFQEEISVIKSWAMLHEEVRCENYTKPLAEIAEHKAVTSVVKVAPPQKVEVRGLSASWTVNFTREKMFEVELRSADQSWTDAKKTQTAETHLDLSEDDLFLQRQYVIRVRVKHVLLPNAIWSDWSQEYSWTSEVGQTPPTPVVPVFLSLDWSVAGPTLTGVTLVVVWLCVIVICCDRRKSLQKKCSLYIPDPSKFFGDLNSQHGGNFTSWLGPLLARESFIKVDTECVSPVEVLKPPDADSRGSRRDRDSDGLQDRWEGNSKSSNFSNSTYFLSQSSKGPSDTLEPCSTHSSYGPAGGVSGPDLGHAHVTRGSEEKELELSLKTLEKLRQDTQSPDSGFNGGAEDSMEESDLPSPLALNLTRLLPPDLPAPHPIMHLGFERTAGLGCVFPGQLDLGFQSPCGMIEPSSGDYMPVKSVQN